MSNENETPKNENININNEEDVKYWIEHWKITDEQLHNAVGAVGVNIAKIEMWLQKVREQKHQQQE